MSADREIKVGKLFRYKGSETRWRFWTSEAFVTVVCHREDSAKADIFVEQVVFVWRWIVLMPVNILVHAFVRMCRKGLPSWFTSVGTLAMEKSFHCGSWNRWWPSARWRHGECIETSWSEWMHRQYVDKLNPTRSRLFAMMGCNCGLIFSPLSSTTVSTEVHFPNQA